MDPHRVLSSVYMDNGISDIKGNRSGLFFLTFDWIVLLKPLEELKSIEANRQM